MIPCVLNGDVPLPLRREGQTRASPQIPRIHTFFLIGRPTIIDANHSGVELEDIEVNSVGPDVVHHLIMIGKCFSHRTRPCEVREAIVVLGRLEPGGLDGLGPNPSDGGPGLEDDQAKALFQGVFACEEAADSSADDRYSFLLHCGLKH